MQGLQEALLQAMNMVSTSQDNSLQFDRTIECEILFPVDSETGKYQVRYLDGEFYAYDLSLGMKYKTGATVLVQIPQNDFSQKKIILGYKSTSGDLIYSDIKLPQEQVNKIGIPLEQIYPDIQLNEVGIMGAITADRAHGSYLYTPNDYTANMDQVFQTYAKDREILMFEMDFRNSWLTTQVESGNFGIEVVFETYQDKDIHYIIDRNFMSGNMMKYTDWTYICALLSIDGNQLKRLKYIWFFSENFKRSDYTNQGELDDLYDKGEAEIFTRGLSISFAEKIDESGYTAAIRTPQGIYFDQNGNQPLTLEGILKFEGRTEGLEAAKTKYYWYEQDTRISINNPSFDEIAGVGWKFLSNGKILTVGADIFNALAKKYKLVILYGEQKVSKEITLYYTRERLDFEIELIRHEDGTGTLIAPTLTETSITYEWLAVDNNQIAYTFDDHDNELDIDVANIVAATTYYCSLIRSDYVYLTLVKTVYNQQTYADFNIVFDTEDGGLFTYDEKGDMHRDLLIKSINFDIIWAPGTEEKYYTYRWILPETFNDKMFNVATGAVLEGDVYREDKSLIYTIKPRYNAAHTKNNIIKLEVIIDGQVYKHSKTLQFIKEGDPGTNGTSLTMFIEPFDNIRALSNGMGNAITLKPTLYYNGYPVFAGSDVNSFFTFECTIPREYQQYNPLFENTTISIENNLIKIQNILNLNLDLGENKYNFNSIIQIKATPHSQFDIFNYPVIALYAVPLTNNSSWRTAQTTGATNIVYDAKGENPRFSEAIYTIDIDTDAPVAANNSIGFKLEEDKVYIEGEEPRVLGYKASPIAKYKEDSAAGIIFKKDSFYYIQPILFTLNAYSQELLNAWNGSSLEINEEGSYVLAAQLGAGKKESDNSFTGVLMGQIMNHNTGYDGQTGLYGFKNGISTFGFTEKGVGFIGSPNAGRIYLDGENGYIESGNYVKDSSGMRIDMEKGAIDAYNFKLTSSSIKLDSVNHNFSFTLGNNRGSFDIKAIDSNKSLMHVAQNSYYLQSADYSNSNGVITGTYIDLKNGKLISKNVDLYGKITATSGEVGGWTIGTSSIYSGNTILSSDGSATFGLTSFDAAGNATFGGSATFNGTVNAKSFIHKRGTLGDVQGLAATYSPGGELLSTSTTDCFGLVSNTGYSIILESGINIRLTANDGNGNIFLDGDTLHFTGTTTKGIYARFR